MRLGQGHCGRVTVLPTGDGTLQSLHLVTRNFCLMAGFPQRPRRLALCLLPVQSTDSGPHWAYVWGRICVFGPGGEAVEW